jgi:ferredoxin
MERSLREKFVLPKGSALGLAVPVACFSTYPTAWRFIDSLPEGCGEVFFLATMGGDGGGMEGPVKKVLSGKGYSPIGALTVKMPGNYGNKTLHAEKYKKQEEAGRAKVKKFAASLLDGTASWSQGRPVISRLFASLAHGRKPWNFFYKLFPLAVDDEKCDSCGLCVTLCPEGNITLAGDGGKASLGNKCQSCQRCIAFCPREAILVPGKPAERYRAVPVESILELLKKAGS